MLSRTRLFAVALLLGTAAALSIPTAPECLTGPGDSGCCKALSDLSTLKDASGASCSTYLQPAFDFTMTEDQRDVSTLTVVDVTGWDLAALCAADGCVGKAMAALKTAAALPGEGCQFARMMAEYYQSLVCAKQDTTYCLTTAQTAWDTLYPVVSAADSTATADMCTDKCLATAFAATARSLPVVLAAQQEEEYNTQKATWSEEEVEQKTQEYFQQAGGNMDNAAERGEEFAILSGGVCLKDGDTMCWDIIKLKEQYLNTYVADPAAECVKPCVQTALNYFSGYTRAMAHMRTLQIQDHIARLTDQGHMMLDMAATMPAGGVAPTTCTADAECDEATEFCDTVAGTCKLCDVTCKYGCTKGAKSCKPEPTGTTPTTCTKDADCKAATKFCLMADGSGTCTACDASCTEGCTTSATNCKTAAATTCAADGDCAATEFCLMAEGSGTCTACDASCTEGCTTSATNCKTAATTCTADGDCAATEFCLMADGSGTCTACDASCSNGCTTSATNCKAARRTRRLQATTTGTTATGETPEGQGPPPMSSDATLPFESRIEGLKKGVPAGYRDMIAPWLDAVKEVGKVARDVTQFQGVAAAIDALAARGCNKNANGDYCATKAATQLTDLLAKLGPEGGETAGTGTGTEQTGTETGGTTGTGTGGGRRLQRTSTSPNDLGTKVGTISRTATKEQATEGVCGEIKDTLAANGCCADLVLRVRAQDMRGASDGDNLQFELERQARQVVGALYMMSGETQGGAGETGTGTATGGTPTGTGGTRRLQDGAAGTATTTGLEAGGEVTTTSTGTAPQKPPLEKLPPDVAQNLRMVGLFQAALDKPAGVCKVQMDAMCSNGQAVKVKKVSKKLKNVSCDKLKANGSALQALTDSIALGYGRSIGVPASDVNVKICGLSAADANVATYDAVADVASASDTTSSGGTRLLLGDNGYVFYLPRRLQTAATVDITSPPPSTTTTGAGTTTDLDTAVTDAVSTAVASNADLASAVAEDPAQPVGASTEAASTSDADVTQSAGTEATAAEQEAEAVQPVTVAVTGVNDAETTGTTEAPTGGETGGGTESGGETTGGGEEQPAETEKETVSRADAMLTVSGFVCLLAMVAGRRALLV